MPEYEDAHHYSQSFDGYSAAGIPRNVNSGPHNSIGDTLYVETLKMPYYQNNI